MPTFLNILPGVIAAGIVIPSLLALYFLKLRRVEHAVPSTLLWKKSIQDLQVNAPFQKLRRNLLMLLQLLALALLVLALARPVLPFVPEAGKSTVILIDRSASMKATDGGPRGATRLDEAKRRAKELVETLPRNGSAMVVAFDEGAETVQPFTGDVGLLKRQIDSIEAGDRKTQLKLAFQLAEAQAAVSSEAGRELSRPDVWVFSDGRVSDAADLRLQGELKYERVGSDKSVNVGIVGLSARRAYDAPTRVQVFVRLANFGPEPVDADVQLSVDGVAKSVAQVSLLPERYTDEQRAAAEAAGKASRASAEFTLELLESAVLRVEVAGVAGDVLAADDVAHIIVPPPKPLRVLLVSDGNNPYLAKVLEHLNLQDPKTLATAAYEAAVPGEYDVIIFDNHRPKALPPAGNFLHFGALPEGLLITAETVEGALVVDPDAGEILDWQREHPMLRELALDRIVFTNGITLKPAPTSDVLVFGVKSPVMVLHREGRSTHLCVAFDPVNSNWPLRASWPVFMFNAMQYLAASSQLDVPQSIAPGTALRLAASAAERAGLPEAISLRTPAGQTLRVAVPKESDLVLPAMENVGLYRLEPSVPPYETLAVNLLDDAESNTLPLQTPPGNIGTATAMGAGQARLELWWWLVAVGVIPLLLIEWVVYTRRAHL